MIKYKWGIENGEWDWGMGNEELRMVNETGECGMGNGEWDWGMANGELGLGNGK